MSDCDGPHSPRLRALRRHACLFMDFSERTTSFRWAKGDRGWLGRLILCRSGTFSPPKGCSPLTKIQDRKSTRLNSSHQIISYAVFCFKKKKKNDIEHH